MKVLAIFQQEQPAQVFKIPEFLIEAEGMITLLLANAKSSLIALFANETIRMNKWKHMPASTTPLIHIDSI